MRRASEGVHASLVQQRNETKCVKDKVRLHILNCISCFTIFFACLIAALALGSDGGVKERYCGGKGKGCLLLYFSLFASSHPIVFA